MRFERIDIDPKICFGKPRIRGTRMTVEFVLKLIASGMDAKKITQEYPEVELQDVYACADYGSYLAGGEHYDF